MKFLFYLVLCFIFISCSSEDEKKVDNKKNIKKTDKKVVVSKKSNKKKKKKKKRKKRDIKLPKGMVKVRGGRFYMGDYFKLGDDNEQPVFKVKLKDFFISKYEVTFEEFDKFCEATKREKPDDSGFGRGKKPVINVSWKDAIDYCNWRSKQEKLDKCYSKSMKCSFKKVGYRLPTEAEWEYVASEIFKIRKPKKKKINHWENSGLNEKRLNFNSLIGKTTDVGSFKSFNKIYDLFGNVSEWCYDIYGEYTKKSKKYPSGLKSGDERVYRGGSWDTGAFRVRSTSREYDHYEEFFNDVGFRLAMTGE